MKVNLFIVGVKKCGSTTLFELMNGHPEICGSSEKEPDFFIDPDPSRLKAYQDLFDHTASHYLDASVLYAAPGNGLSVSKRIFEYNPAAKIIYIIREPVARFESHHWHAFNRGYFTVRDINKDLYQGDNLETSKYYSNLKPFIDHFGMKNILILKTEDLNENPNKLFRQIGKFLSVDPGLFSLKQTHSNISNKERWINKRYDVFFESKAYGLLRQSIPNSIIQALKRSYFFLSGNLKVRPQLNDENRFKLLVALKGELSQMDALLKEQHSLLFEDMNGRANQ